MQYARVGLARLLADVAASSDIGGNVLTCPAVNAQFSIFERFLTATPASGTLRPVPTETVKVFNPHDQAFTSGDFVQIGQLIDETWVIIAGGGGTPSTPGCGTEAVIFEIPTQSGSAQAASGDCVDQLMDAANSYTVNVKWRPCCSTKVSQETDQGTIVVYDVLGSFLANRENSQAEGKLGVAIFMKEVGGYECQWVITFIDWWREIQVIEDVIHTASEIRFKVKKVQVWDDCQLDDIVIPLIDCADNS